MKRAADYLSVNAKLGGSFKVRFEDENQESRAGSKRKKPNKALAGCLRGPERKQGRWSSGSYKGNGGVSLSRAEGTARTRRGRGETRAAGLPYGHFFEWEKALDCVNTTLKAADEKEAFVDSGRCSGAAARWLIT
jgi:hypothetical protein